MKTLALFGLICLLFSCTDDQVNDIQLTDLKEYNMKIIPENPISNSEIKLVVFDDCTYNVLAGVTRKDNTISIKKQFNGMMKWPCVMRNDTISIGKLPGGKYIATYTLIDVSKADPQNISLSFSFSLKVGK